MVGSVVQPVGGPDRPESATSCWRPTPSTADPWVTRRITHQAPTSATTTAIPRANKTTVESWADKNMNRTLSTTVPATASTGNKVTIIS